MGASNPKGRIAVSLHAWTASPEIARHYEGIDEGRRLTQGLGELELIRTKEALSRHLPRAGSRILDVGGATGVHASWLAAQVHTVHVIEPLPHHVDAALQLSGVTAFAKIGSVPTTGCPLKDQPAPPVTGALTSQVELSDCPPVRVSSNARVTNSSVCQCGSVRC